MDSITQLVVGGIIGEKTLGKKLGNKAVMWGALIGTIPDLDVIFSFFYDTVDQLFIHRGASHSLFFCLLAPVIIALLFKKYDKRKSVSFYQWWQFSFFVLLGAVVLDYLTAYGASILWPFSDYRIEMKTISIADLFFTLPLLTLLIIILFSNRIIRSRLINVALIFGVVYLSLTAINKLHVNHTFKSHLKLNEKTFTRLTTTPMPLTNFLWTGIAETSGGFWIGTYSLFDNHPVQFEYVAKNEQILSPYRGNENLEKLLCFTKGYYKTEVENENILVNDLRFGKFNSATNNNFVFTFVVTSNEDGIVIKEKEREKVFTNKEFKQYLHRIWGSNGHNN